MALCKFNGIFSLNKTYTHYVPHRWSDDSQVNLTEWEASFPMDTFSGAKCVYHLRGSEYARTALYMLDEANLGNLQTRLVLFLSSSLSSLYLFLISRRSTDLYTSLPHPPTH